MADPNPNVSKSAERRRTTLSLWLVGLLFAVAVITFTVYSTRIQRGKTTALRLIPADFSDPSGLNFVGDAAPIDDVVRLAANTYETGAVWYDTPQIVSLDFTTSFDFQLLNDMRGFAFVIQNDHDSSIGQVGKNLGYGWMPNSLAIEFDSHGAWRTVWDEFDGDPPDPHVSVHTRGPLANSGHEACSIGVYSDPDLQLSGPAHTATIGYEHTSGTMNVSLDGVEILSVSVDLGGMLDLDQGRAWVGFTSATWRSPGQHDILSWDYTSQADASPAIAISDVERFEAADGGSTDFLFTVSRFGSPTGAVLVDLETANGTAEAGVDKDYLMKTETIEFQSGDATPKTFTVTVNGDNVREGREYFLVNISSVKGAEIADGEGRGSILDNDPHSVFQLSSLLSTNGGDGSTGFVIHGGAGWRDALGDVNGDGFDDFAVPDAFANVAGRAGAGKIYVVYGAAAGLPPELDPSSLNGSNGFVINGIDAGDAAGTTVSGAGDVNGDGISDIIITTRIDETYVVFGSESGFPASFELSSLNGVNGFIVIGAGSGDRNVTSAGDVNGDGFADLVIGVRGADLRAGHSYVVLGRAAGFGAVFDLATLLPENGGDGSDGFVLLGVDPVDLSGWPVSSARDVNGDGFDDLMIGAMGADPNGPASGETYVVFGKASFGASVPLASLDGSNGFVINGVQALDRIGFPVGAVGDVNGDGYDDVVIGSTSNEVYVLFGKPGGYAASFELASLDGSNGFVISGIEPSDAVQNSLNIPGDINGDGFDDIIVGSASADPIGVSQAGESYVIYGTADAFPANLELSTLNGANGFSLLGIDAYDNSGWLASSANDVNGDGFDDLFIVTGDYVVFGSDRTHTVTHSGTAGDDLLTGDANDNVMVGGQANDTLVGNGGVDVLLGGEGDDVVAVSDIGFQRIDGGNGADTLRLDGVGVTLDLTAIPNNRIMGIEEIDITGSGDNTLTLDVLEVLNLSDTSNTLVVRSSGADAVNLGAGWTDEGFQLVDGTLFRVYTQGAATVLTVEEPAGSTPAELPGGEEEAGNAQQEEDTKASAQAKSKGETPAEAESGSGVTAGWPQLGFDAQRTSFNPHERQIGPSNVGALEVLWANSVSSTINYGVSVVDGVVYYGLYHGEFRAVNAATGTRLWSKASTARGGGFDLSPEGMNYLARVRKWTTVWCRKPNGTVFAASNPADPSHLIQRI